MTGTHVLPALACDANVVFDEWDIPFVEAASARDAAMVTGWLHARERLVTMELVRRVATGTLAALIGRGGLRSDRLMRTLGFAHVARAERAALERDGHHDVVEELEAYAAGVNAWLAAHPQRGRGWELRLLATRVAPWRAADCLLVSRLFALGLCANWEAELTRAEVLVRFGAKVLRAYDGDALDAELLERVRRELTGADALAAVRATLAAVPNVVADGGPHAGSNAWAVAPSRTVTGGAILAGDTHLDLSIPCTWYEVGVAWPGHRARGCSLPGAPGLAIGTNGNVAWTLANATADVQDFAIETVEGDAYRDETGAWQSLDVRDERIAVRGGRTRAMRVRCTPRGPLITDCVAHVTGAALALRWPAGLEPGTLPVALHHMNRARDVAELRDATRWWSAPSQQVVAADRHGTIVRQLVGRIPVRTNSDGRIPRGAHDADATWRGEVPWESLPVSLDPACGYVVCANDRFSTGQQPEPFISRDWANPWRAQRIRTVLGDGRGLDVADHQRLQLDVHSLPGCELRDLLRPLRAQIVAVARARTADTERALDALLAWDGDLRADSTGGAVYATLMEELQARLWSPLGELAPAMLGAGRGPAGGTSIGLHGRATPRILHDLRTDDTTLLRLAGDTSWTVLLARALADTAHRLDRLHGGAPWQYGTSHRIRVAHPFGFVPGLHRLVSHGPWPIGGDTDTVCQATLSPKVHNDHAVVGPAQRMVIDLADPDRSVAVLCGGQAARSRHVADQLELWRQGLLRPMPLSHAAVLQSGVRREGFTPST